MAVDPRANCNTLVCGPGQHCLYEDKECPADTFCFARARCALAAYVPPEFPPVIIANDMSNLVSHRGLIGEEHATYTCDGRQNERYYLCKPCESKCSEWASNRTQSCRNHKCVPGCACIPSWWRKDQPGFGAGTCVKPRWCNVVARKKAIVEATHASRISVPTSVNPCASALCFYGDRCVVKKGKPVCIQGSVSSGIYPPARPHYSTSAPSRLSTYRSSASGKTHQSKDQSYPSRASMQGVIRPTTAAAPRQSYSPTAAMHKIRASGTSTPSYSFDASHFPPPMPVNLPPVPSSFPVTTTPLTLPRDAPGENFSIVNSCTSSSCISSAPTRQSPTTPVLSYRISGQMHGNKSHGASRSQSEAETVSLIRCAPNEYLTRCGGCEKRCHAGSFRKQVQICSKPSPCSWQCMCKPGFARLKDICTIASLCRAHYRTNFPLTTKRFIKNWSSKAILRRRGTSGGQRCDAKCSMDM